MGLPAATLSSALWCVALAGPAEPTTEGDSTTAADERPSELSGDAASPAPTPLPEVPSSPAGTDAADAGPLPHRYSFATSNTFDGKVGVGSLWMHAQPFGASSGYGQVFWQGDYDGIAGSRFSLHWDLDARALLYEPRGSAYLTQDGALVEQAPDGSLESSWFYRTPQTYVSGRTSDYLRLDALYAAYESDSFGAALGRMVLPQASALTVDGLDLWFGLGRLGRAGVFAGLRPNPWHQQVVGLTSGGTLYEGAGYSPLWGDVAVDQDFSLRTGSASNDLFTLPDTYFPWLQLGSSRFVSGGMYGSVRTERFSLDTSLTVDLFDGATFDYGVDRVWWWAQGAVRLLDQLSLAFRGTLDVVGARPLVPRDVYLDLTWRRLGPLTLGLRYAHINTYATALSYGYFFRPLEDPAGVTRDPANLDNPFPGSALQLNNQRLFLVERDRVTASAALLLSGSLEFYGDLGGERRGDTPYAAQQDVASGVDALLDAAQMLPSNLCFSPPSNEGKPTGVNPDVPVYDDLCRVSGSLGIRDPFLGHVGLMDVRVTWLDGYFQSTRRLSGRAGVSALDVLWLEIGGAIENNHNHRVYVNGYASPSSTTPLYTAATTDAYLLDASLAWQVWQGLSVEASYYAILEEVPSQGDTRQDFGSGDALRRDTYQSTHMVYSRTLYRF